MLARFFIDRPIFAAVVSLAITLAGGFALSVLPVAQFPEISPPTVQVSCSYPGANARVVADTVAAPIEQEVNGVEGMLYLSSTSANDGSYTLTCTFDLGTDLNTALVMVQNRLALAMPQLPAAVQRQGLTIRKKTPDLLLVVNFISPDGRYDPLYLSNYATIHIKDALLRVDGVSDINYLGERDYSMRAWLDPQKLAAYSVTVGDVASAIRDQSTPAALGAVGVSPTTPGQTLQLPLDTLGRLHEADQFGDIIVKRGAANELLRLRDVARIELGAQNYNMVCTLDSQPSVALGIHQLPGTNALDVAQRVRDKMEELKERFPAGVDYRIIYDTTPFVRESLRDLGWTLLEASGLVALVVLLFLREWRAALIPLAAVPVAIIGTFAAMAALQYSVNTISLFGLVLAIGIVVDDAIVVVENVERWVEQGLPPREAAGRAMDEVTGPIVAVALVLAAVFVPCAFIPGITGQLFRQFALTIAVSTALSALNSLTLSPALAALLLRPRSRPSSRSATHGFHRFVAWSMASYTRVVGRLLRRRGWVLLVYVGLLALAGVIFHKAPAGFIPPQDVGHCFVTVELPDSASLQRTTAVMARVEELTRQTPGVAHTITASGTALVLGINSPNFGTMFVTLDPFALRRSPELHVDAIMTRLRQQFAGKIKDAEVSVFGAPAIPGVSLAGGFMLMVEDRAAQGPVFLQQQTDELVRRLRPDEALGYVHTPFRASTPQLYLDIDRDKVRALGVSLKDVDEALQGYLGSLYVNSFNEFGRYWQVSLMAEGRYRWRVEDIGQLQVRNLRGEMVPLSTLTRVRYASGPIMIQHYNLYESAPVLGFIRWTASTGDAVAEIETQARESLPRTMRAQWTQLMFFQIRAGDTARYGFALGVVFVFLALAALYESWTLPLAVILVVPLCLLCSAVTVLAGRTPINLFVEIGFVLLVGLACKNAILLVEYARRQREAGVERTEATLTACRIRLRPILMTSFALILGVVPLVLAQGAGAEMRRSLGLAVFGGMLGVTLFGIFLTPVFFHLLDSMPLTPRRVGALLLAGVGLLFVGWMLGELAKESRLRAWAAGVSLAVLAVALTLFRRWHGRPAPVDRQATTAPTDGAPAA